jgi:hypothetical protein
VEGTRECREGRAHDKTRGREHQHEEEHEADLLSSKGDDHSVDGRTYRFQKIKSMNDVVVLFRKLSIEEMRDGKQRATTANTHKVDLRERRRRTVPIRIAARPSANNSLSELETMVPVGSISFIFQFFLASLFLSLLFRSLFYCECDEILKGVIRSRETSRQSWDSGSNTSRASV